MTLAAGDTANDYEFINCHSLVSGNTKAILDVNSVTTPNISVRDYTGGLDVRNFTGGSLSLDGQGRLLIDSTCTGGEIVVGGQWELTDNSGAGCSVIYDSNNPTGTAVSTDALAAMLERVPEETVVVIDEAYREFVDPRFGDPVADLLPRFANVVVTRTMSKAHGLASLRFGYGVASPEVVSSVDKTLAPFAVSGLAQAAAIAAIEAEAEIRDRVDSILAERDRVIAELAGHGWALPDAQANFVYLPTGARTDEIYVAMEKRGVVTRPFSGEGIRVTTGTRAENDRFLETLSAVV